jgi:LPS O-antigen subunit length determinant protein (WzzB/FepE family)
MKLPRLTKKIWIIVITAGVVVLTLVPSLYFYNQYRQAQEKLQNPQINAKEEIKRIIEKVSRLMVLPEGEEPTVATVSDVEKLKSQPFFVKAQNGDKVLIFTAAKKAILYRPSLNKIVDIAPINVGQDASTPSAQPDQKSSFVLYNGTLTVGLTKKYETELKTKLPNANVIDSDTAKKKDYEKTILVELSKTNSAKASEIAQTLGISVAELPSGETAPTGADFLIIVGADKK